MQHPGDARNRLNWRRQPLRKKPTVPQESVGKKSSATGNAGVSPAMSAERNEVERSANTALAAEILGEVVVATGLVRASLRCASFALIAGGTPAVPEQVDA